MTEIQEYYWMLTNEKPKVGDYFFLDGHVYFLCNSEQAKSYTEWGMVFINNIWNLTQKHKSALSVRRAWRKVIPKTK